MTKPKVFIPNVPTRWDPLLETRVPSVDLRPAQPYGELRVLLEHETPLDPAGTAEAFDELQARMFALGSRETDFVVALGDPILIAAAISHQITSHGTASVLRWNRLHAAYELVEL